MLSLTVTAIHLDGQAGEAVTGQFNAHGGSIGRDSGCDLVLPDRRVSRVQAYIAPVEGQYVIHNASVSNPMLINGMELPPGSSQPVSDGDELRIASYEIVVVTDGVCPPPAIAEQPEMETLEAASQTVGVAAESDNPFGDLLAQALPIGAEETNVALAFSDVPAAIVSTEPPGFRANYVPANPPDATPVPMPAPMPATSSGVSPDNVREQARTVAPSPINPFALSDQNQAGAANRQPQWVPPPPVLAGDPFADLMGPPVESHMARVPAPASVPTAAQQETTLIPQDFNPFALGGVAQRNSPDPLTPLGRDAQGLADVQPTQTVDSIYAPGTESATALVVDSLEDANARALQVGQNTDPLKLFASEGHGVDEQPDDRMIGVRSVPDHALEITSYFRPPTARIDPAFAPEQVPVAEIGGEISLPSEQKGVDSLPSPAVSGQEAAAAVLVPAATVPALPDTAELAHPALQSFPESAAAEGHGLGTTATPPVPAERFTGSEDSDSVAGRIEELMSAFKRGAGLQDWEAQPLTPEWMEIMGRMLQTATQGAVSLLAARAAVKREIHLAVTQINPAANNPLKFLPDGHMALQQMLGPPMPGFMAPVEAMEEAFEDLVTHQTAITAGTQAAVEALFQRLAPDMIESQDPQNGVSDKMSQTLHNARLWSLYKSQYNAIRDETQDNFFRSFGAEFHEAYNREYDRDVPGKQ